ncbi:MAG: DUF1559 domain-containing protein [Planctomycetaceae bacterium]|nr:DUF1559 domain-containing protein [Planctomycetaceae bacterium]
MSKAQEVLDTAIANQPKKRGWWRGCLIVCLLLALPYYWVGCHTTRLRVSEETTRALGPMTADGKRLDYFRAMEERYYPPEMKTDDNGYRLIVRAFGANISDERHRHNFQTGENYSEKFDSEPLRLQVYEKLGLDPNVEPTMKPVESPWNIIYQYDKDHPVAEGERAWVHKYQDATFWTFDDFPMLEQWYEENTAGIDLLAEAVRKPAFFIPFTRKYEHAPVTESILDLELVQLPREWSRAVQARANYRLGIGDIDGVIDDIITIHHLARHSGKQGFLVSGLVGIAIEGMAISVGIGSNPEFPPTKEQIERLVRELDALPPRPAYHECLESERYFALAALQDQYWGINPGMMDDMFPITLLPFLGWAVDINIAMNRLNKVYDVITNPNPVENDDTKWVDQIFSGTSARPINPFPLLFVRSRTNKIMDSLINLLVSAMQAGREGWRRLECATNMQRLTLALLLYEKEHGTLPEGDWREAIRPYLGANADRYFQCPSHLRLAAGETNYAMIGGVPNGIDSPTRILIAEVTQPQRLGEGDGRLPFEKAQFGDRLDTDFDGLGSYHTGGMNTGFRSGGMRFVLESTEPEDLRAFLDGR